MDCRDLVSLGGRSGSSGGALFTAISFHPQQKAVSPRIPQSNQVGTLPGKLPPIWWIFRHPGWSEKLVGGHWDTQTYVPSIQGGSRLWNLGSKCLQEITPPNCLTICGLKSSYWLNLFRCEATGKFFVKRSWPLLCTFLISLIIFFITIKEFWAFIVSLSWPSPTKPCSRSLNSLIHSLNGHPLRQVGIVWSLLTLTAVWLPPLILLLTSCVIWARRLLFWSTSLYFWPHLLTNRARGSHEMTPFPSICVIQDPVRRQKPHSI